MAQIFFVFILIYAGCVLFYLAIICMALDDVIPYKYTKPDTGLLFPIAFYYLFYDLFTNINNYLTKNNLKQMNFKILGKAMGFMFLPTFGVLLMLLVGFFDPIAMWTFIKSDSSWAVFVRVILFIAEIVLVIVMYYHYLKKEQLDQIKNNNYNDDDDDAYAISNTTDVYQLYEDQEYNHHNFVKYNTSNPDIVVVKRTKTNN